MRATAVAWPRLRSHVALDDPSPVLVAQLWVLTMLVGERATVRQLRKDLSTSGVGVPAGTYTEAPPFESLAAGVPVVASIGDSGALGTWSP